MALELNGRVLLLKGWIYPSYVGGCFSFFATCIANGFRCFLGQVRDRAMECFDMLLHQ